MQSPCKSLNDQYTYHMSKRVFFLAFGVIATISVAAILLVNLTKTGKITSPIDENSKEKVVDNQKLSGNLKEYTDPSGFKFKYPNNFIVSANDQLNENVYSSLTLGSDKIASQTSILVEATNTKSLDDWLLKNKIRLSEEKLLKTKLTDLAAVQYEADGKVITIAYDTGALFTITTELKPDRETMLDLHKTILESFAFQQPPPPSSETALDGEVGDVIFEGEETIE